MAEHLCQVLEHGAVFLVHRPGYGQFCCAFTQLYLQGIGLRHHGRTDPPGEGGLLDHVQPLELHLFVQEWITLTQFLKIYLPLEGLQITALDQTLQVVPIDAKHVCRLAHPDVLPHTTTSSIGFGYRCRQRKNLHG